MLRCTIEEGQMRKAIVVGTGAGGATAARELQGKFDVTILESGGEFRPFSTDLSFIERLKRAGLMRDERWIRLLFPAMNVTRTRERMAFVRGNGLGGTTTLATGNGIRMDGPLKEIGINLDAEFAELGREIPVSTGHQKRWRPVTRRLFGICRELNLDPVPLPKLGDTRRCINCGLCVLGCPRGAKWDSRQFVDEARAKGATLLTRSRVERVVSSGSRATGVIVRKGLRRRFISADLVILAAGGFGTPGILNASGVECERTLFVDPVLCVAAEWKGSLQNRDISMPFVVQREGFILSPYFDYLSFFFNRDWRFQADDTLGLMVKIADSSSGSVSGGQVEKSLTGEDARKLKAGVELCAEIFGHMGIGPEKLIQGTLNAGHPGGMLPLTQKEAETFHNDRLPENLYVADATLFPHSPGNPPILTIMAMAKRVARVCSIN
jgi:choline dehydrogenase-like flavoprotein